MTSPAMLIVQDSGSASFSSHSGLQNPGLGQIAVSISPATVARQIIDTF